jgi:hypothetical protein
MVKILSADFHSSLLRNSLIQLTWWIVFFPGFFSGDSFSAIQMAKTGELGNSFTASWALYVRIFSLHGHAIPLLTLINGMILVYAVTRLGYAVFNGRAAAISTFLMTLTPVVSGMGITLWHDILMTAGIILLTSFFIGIHKDFGNTKKLLILEMLPGAILSSFRPNGLPTIVVFAFVYGVFVLTKHRTHFFRVVKMLISVILITTSITIVNSSLILGLSPINKYFAQEWMRNDISCFADSDSGKGFVERNIPGIGSTNSWRSSNACSFLNKAKVSEEDKVAAEKYISSAWFTLFTQNPSFVIGVHAKRNAYLLPLPIFGVPTTPFLHSTIEVKSEEIVWAFPSIAEKARFFMRAWNAGRGFIAWAGLWALIMVGLSVFAGRKNLAPLISMSVALIALIFIVAPIPDGRYALFVLIAGQLVFVGHIVEWAQTGSNRRPTD